MSTVSPLKSSLVQRTPIYYGWVIWMVATLGLTATSPGQSFSVSLFIDHYIDDFGLTRTGVSALYGIGTLIASFSLTWVGRRIDRHGTRLVGICIAALFGLVLLACSLIAGPVAILLSFIFIRALGQGSMSLLSTSAIALWFQKIRGRVLGISLVGFALFQRIYLPWLQQYIDQNGWRQAWMLLGVVILVVVLPMFALLLRNRPEDFGLLPDGGNGAAADKKQQATLILTEDNWTLSEAFRTPMFWAFVFPRVLVGLFATAMVFHQISLFDALGHSAQVAAATYGQAAIMTAGFTLLAGWLVDRVRPVYLVAIQMIGLAAASGMALIMTESWLLFVYTALFGIYMGTGSVFDGTVWVNLYGRLHQGAIRGFVITAIVAGTSVGPILFGLSYDVFGSYDAGLVTGIVLALIALGGAIVVQPPRRTR